MTTPTSVSDAVASCLDRFVERMREESRAYGPEGQRFVAAATRAITGGKRLRARFCHAGWSAVSRVSDRTAAAPEALWHLCAALEVFQAAALVHDDLIDNSDTRRGQPAAHRALQAEHVDAGWSGDAESFGRSAALLLGDLLVAWSDDLLEQALAGHPLAAGVRAEYAQMRRDVTTGQFLDIAEESAWSTTPASEHADRALRVVEFKAARYSVEQPLRLGALLAGADDEQLAALSRFGRPVGMAFQLRDDVLGVFGDERVTGKPSGDDLREGKRTVLVAFTRERLEAPARTVMDESLGDADLTNAQIAAMQTTVRESGALDRVESLIEEFAEQADRSLSGARLDDAAVGELRDLARAATARVA